MSREVSTSFSSNELPIAAAAQKIADANNFVIQSYGFEAIKEDLRKPRVVRIGAVQTSIAASTSAPVSVQREKVFEKIGKIIEAAAADNVNILCLQELWSELVLIRNILKTKLIYQHPKTDCCSLRKGFDKLNN